MAHRMASLAVSFDPKSSAARITLGAILLRLGVPAEAEQQFSRAEMDARSYVVKSRALANRAVVQEIYGNPHGAKRLSEIAVQLPEVSSLAIRNYRVYQMVYGTVN
jgi:Flp pilus assembly protein TadD